MSNAVKGTTRVSNNDRKLMKDLWVAGKDNPVEKNRLKRKLTQIEKATRQAMPEERAEAAFKNVRKRQKALVPRIEAQENDDVVAVKCIQNSTWSDFCWRQRAVADDTETLRDFQAFLKTRKKKVTNGGTTVATTATEHGAQMRWLARKEMPFTFLGDVKNKRFNNYRRKMETYRQRMGKLCTESTLKQLPEYFFPNTAVPGAYEVRFAAAPREQGFAQLITANDYHNDFIRLLTECRNAGATMHFSLAVGQPRTTATSCADSVSSSKKRVELFFNNGYDSVRQPRIMIRCDRCLEIVPSTDVVPQEHRLFFHSSCCRKAEIGSNSLPTSTVHYSVFKS
jgi:hypothetical protein